MGIGGEAMNWEAIRALPEPIVGENEWWDFFDNDLFMAPSEQPRFWQVLQAAHEAQALLKEHDRAVEVLRLAKRAFARPLDLELFGDAGGAVWEFLHELEGEQK